MPRLGIAASLVATALLMAVGPEIVASPPLLASTEPTAQAESTAVERVIEKSIASLGPLTVLGGILWWKIRYGDPDRDKQAAAERELYLKESRAEREAHRQIVENLVGELKASREQVLLVVRSCEARRAGEHG